MSSRAQEAARKLAEARASGHQLDDLPVDLAPRTLADAYAIQDVYAANHSVYGWKVAPARDDRDPRCAILLGGAPLSAGVVLSGVAARATDIELEIAIRLAKDFPFRERAYQLADIEGAISSVHLAIELIGSSFRNREVQPVPTGVADHQSNVGIVLGAPLEDWRDLDLADIELSLSLDGEERARLRVGVALADLLGPVAWLANHAATRPRSLNRGDVVITGARIGPVPLLGATLVKGCGSPFAPVALSRTAQQA